MVYQEAPAPGLSVKFAGLDIADISAMPLIRLSDLLLSTAGTSSKQDAAHPERAIVAQRITDDLVERIGVMLDLGLGYLSLEHPARPRFLPANCSGRCVWPRRSVRVFGVVYLDEPSAGLHIRRMQAHWWRSVASGVRQFAFRRRT